MHKPNEPTVEEMASLGKTYKKHWIRLCENPVFMSLVDTDVKRAAICAEMLINGKTVKKLKDVKKPKY